ncbi:MAG: endolytic transglycosylase MltG [Spirochaetia bacterium]|nr:endolytic transglycosylase MltG [Spirochaetia bacterium]
MEQMMKMPNLRKIMQFFLLSIGLLVMAFSILMVVAPFRRAPSEVKIKNGATLSSVSRDLRAANVIPSSKIFALYMRLAGAERAIKPGTYRFEPSLPPYEVARKLIRGDTIALKVMIPEGRTARQIAQILESQNIVDASTFLAAVNDPVLTEKLGIPAKSSEGYLFPDTYFFEPGSDAEQIVVQMVANFRAAMKKIAGEMQDTLNAQALYEKVILASMVEREYRVPEDAPLIASVFVNRLSKNMPLQSCATVVYVLTEHLGRPHPSIVYYNDLRVKDPYNTYLNRGLPPGPISNPGEVSLKAALFPSKTDFLYFRLDDSSSGKHRFSRTLQEHNEAGIIPKGL